MADGPDRDQLALATAAVDRLIAGCRPCADDLVRMHEAFRGNPQNIARVTFKNGRPKVESASPKKAKIGRYINAIVDAHDRRYRPHGGRLLLGRVLRKGRANNLPSLLGETVRSLKREITGTIYFLCAEHPSVTVSDVRYVVKHENLPYFAWSSWGDSRFLVVPGWNCATEHEPDATPFEAKQDICTYRFGNLDIAKRTSSLLASAGRTDILDARCARSLGGEWERRLQKQFSPSDLDTIRSRCDEAAFATVSEQRRSKLLLDIDGWEAVHWKLRSNSVLLRYMDPPVHLYLDSFLKADEHYVAVNDTNLPQTIEQLLRDPGRCQAIVAAATKTMRLVDEHFMRLYFLVTVQRFLECCRNSQ